MGYLDYAGLQYLWGKLKEKFAPKSHSHDDRYYTEAEMDGKLNSKSNTNHTHDASTLINALGTGAAAPTDPDYIITQWVGGGTSNTTWVRRPMSSIWSYIKGKADGVYQPKGSYAASGHTHDDRYYTETEINTKLNGKAPNGHTHQYLSLYGARPANINFTKSTNGTGAMFHFVATSSTTTGKPPDDSSILQLNWDNNGGWDSQLALSTTAKPHVYYRNQQNGTWGNWSTLLDNLNYADYAAKKEHTHTKSQITDFPASLKNPTALTIQTNGTTAATYDGSAAKAVNITKGNIGLGNVDNTADADKSVKYAANAGSANTANGISISDPILATGVDNSEITGKTNGNVSFSNYNQSSGIWGMRNALDFRWYKTHWQVGNIRGASDNSTGFGFAFSNDGGQTFALKSRIDTDGVYQGKATTAGYADSAGSANTSSSCTGNSASATKLTSSAGSATQPVYFKDGKPVAGTYTLGDASSKTVRTLGAVGNTGWANKTTDDKYIPTMSFMAYWNGAYSGTSSNLQYCDRGRFGTIVTKGSGDYAAASHTHNYAGSGSAGGSANSAIKLDSSAGSAIQPVYFKDGKPVATTYTLNKTVPADAKFTDTNTWRGIQNNLISDSTDQSLSAAQGKALKTLVDGKAPASHKHTKSQITDFPTSMPASDVSAWAKAATKPSYTKAEVGLSNVDNTADKDKSVKYAASAGSALQLNGFTIQASTSDLTAGYSRLNNNVIYIVYE